jgi:hypothetical protein
MFSSRKSLEAKTDKQNDSILSIHIHYEVEKKEKKQNPAA